MANLLNLKIKLKGVKNSLEFDTGNLSEAQIRERVQSLGSDILQYLSSAQIALLTEAQVKELTETQIGYLSDTQIGEIQPSQLQNLTDEQLESVVNDKDFEDLVDKIDWSNVRIDEGAALLDFIRGGVDSNKPLTRSNYSPVDADAFTSDASARVTGETDVERLLAGFATNYGQEEDWTRNKIFLWKTYALAAMNAACANALTLNVTLNDITDIRELDPEDDSSETNMGYAYAQGLTVEDLTAFFDKAGIEVMFDDDEHTLYKRDNHYYQKLYDTIVLYNSTNLVLNTDLSDSSEEAEEETE